MDLETTDVIIVAQAETPAAVEHEAATEESHETAEAHGAEGELHEGTEAHAEAGHSDVFPPFDPATFGPQLIWLAITFAILYLVMRNVALPRIGSILSDRKSRIDSDLATADASRQRTDAAIAAYESALAEARRRSQALAEETRNALRTDIDSRRHAIETDLSARMAEADTRIQATKATALAHVDEIAVETVEALVARLTGPVSPEDARAAVAQVGRS